MDRAYGSGSPVKGFTKNSKYSTCTPPSLFSTVANTLHRFRPAIRRHCSPSRCVSVDCMYVRCVGEVHVQQQDSTTMSQSWSFKDLFFLVHARLPDVLTRGDWLEPTISKPHPYLRRRTQQATKAGLGQSPPLKVCSVSTRMERISTASRCAGSSLHPSPASAPTEDSPHDALQYLPARGGFHPRSMLPGVHQR